MIWFWTVAEPINQAFDFGCRRVMLCSRFVLRENRNRRLPNPCHAAWRRQKRIKLPYRKMIQCAEPMVTWQVSAISLVKSCKDRFVANQQTDFVDDLTIFARLITAWLSIWADVKHILWSVLLFDLSGLQGTPHPSQTHHSSTVDTPLRPKFKSDDVPPEMR